ncbi:MAG: FecR domain-containing protein [Ectothiorhodospiraceae bacterium]|nr:FecR domain-containing protein [Chromatiales bacterium]MCP5153660.1 FecR domain-containing protein [Ectothiorhodospiraceae bacterium]
MGGTAAHLLTAALLLGVSGASLAAARVEAMQAPAWVERGAARIPIGPGGAVADGDTLRTADGGRVRLRLESGAVVKLGERAALRIEAPAERQSGFGRLLDVLRGAFRYTTATLTRGRETAPTLRVAAMTIGIRGTDVWGKAASDRDIVCLIEGDIEVQRGGDPAVRMRDPLSFYIAPKDAPALPVAAVAPAQLAAWAAETEIAPGAGELRVDGRWALALDAGDDAARRTATLDALRGAGFPLEEAEVGIGGIVRPRLLLPGIATVGDATDLATRLAGRPGVVGIAVIRR